ncbi:MAG: WecB/TagA/CpsF family glycosyltransferase [Limnothrix sp.]|nr:MULTISPECIES: WecB/TagA/CpsF family glycosyltransferase [unclassified Limnothrix]MEB3118717.1 WecB/TagA/CpsF family glycosyltransferase [Limnothrix sp.]
MHASMDASPIAPRPLKATVLQLPVHLLDDYTQWLLDRRQEGGAQVVTLNAEMAIEGERNARLGETIRQADLCIPDGAGVALYLKLRGYRQVRRVPGIELAESVLTAFGRSPNAYGTVWCYGGQPGVAQAAAQAWEKRAPGIQFSGIYHGFLSEDERSTMVQAMREAQPGLILVALGVPRQEYWIAEHRHLCPNAIWIGVGGSFDIWSGTKERAPAWFCENNLEWLYRLYQEPWRWRRMLALPKFAWRALLETLRPQRSSSR